MADNMEIFKQYQDNPSFKKWLSDLVFNLTYNKEGTEYQLPESKSVQYKLAESTLTMVGRAKNKLWKVRMGFMLRRWIWFRHFKRFLNINNIAEGYLDNK